MHGRLGCACASLDHAFPPPQQHTQALGLAMYKELKAQALLENYQYLEVMVNVNGVG